MVFEELVDFIAPARCLVCQKNGESLCQACRLTCLEPAVSRCYRCHKATNQFQVCLSCRKSVKLKHLWVVSMYQGLTKDLLHDLKFGRNSPISNAIAKSMADILPFLPEDTVICHIPTASNRIRVRGYDQSLLIAKSLSKLTNLRRQSLIFRTSKTRQLGSPRDVRFKQAKNSFKIKDIDLIKNKKILLVDDVTTSGASLECVARILHQSGAKVVDAVVFAQAID